MIASIMFSLLFVLLLTGVPIAISLGLAGATGMVLVYGSFSGGSLAIAQSVFTSLSHIILAAIPLYMLMAFVMVNSGIGKDLFDLAERVLGGLPGGLQVATIVTCGGFAAVSGSSSATVATVGGIALPEMLERGESRTKSAGAIAVAGSLGLLIPPSGLLILYGFITGESVGDLFAAGMLPGIMLVIMFSAYSVLTGIYTNHEAEPPTEMSDESTLSTSADAPTHDISLPPQVETETVLDMVAKKPATIPETVVSLFVIPLVLGGIYLGIFTPVESAAVGVIYAIVVGISRCRLPFSQLLAAFRYATKTGALILAIIAGAGIFAQALTLDQLPQAVATWIAELNLPTAAFIIAIMAIGLSLGMFLDGTAIILTLVPVILPVLINMDVDLVWFGILLIMNLEIGCVTPPLGVNLYVLKGIRPDFTVQEILKGALPFALVFMLGLVLVGLFPEIALWLPGVAQTSG